MFTNRVKAQLAEGKAVWGIIAGTPSPALLEISGYLGFDWVLLDNEHGDITVHSMEECVRACEASGLAPIVRPIANRPDVITPFMDRGCYGVQVPHVNTAAEARAAVDAVKFPPLGQRGFFAGSRPNRYGQGMPSAEYLVAANRETLVCVMLEEPEAIGNAAAIAAVEGVDVVFVGAGDLSVTMGYPGQMTHPRVVEALERAVEATLRAGKAAGLSCPEEWNARWLQWGVRYFHGSINGLFARAGRDYLQRMRAAAAEVGAG